MSEGVQQPEPKKVPQKDPSASSLHTFELFKDYTLPDWDSELSNLSLEVIRNGAYLEEKQINEKEFYLVGKLPDLCDIVLEHESISRKHAVIQHSNKGVAHVFDLGSSHGTSVNRKKIPVREFVALHVGDMIRFGFSSRMFILCSDGGVDPLKGTEEEEVQQVIEQQSTKQANKEAYMKLLDQKRNVSNTVKKPEKKKGPTTKEDVHGREGASWGMVAEEDIYAHRDEDELMIDSEVLRQLPDLSDKDIEKIENFEKKLRKLKGIENELRSLYEKEQASFGLSDENQRKKQNLEAKMNESAQQLEIAEDNLKYHFFEESEKTAMLMDEDTFGDDEFYDRTLVKKRKTNEGTAEVSSASASMDFYSLKRKLEELIKQRQEINNEVLAMSMNLKSDQEEQDELDKFMQGNEEKARDERKLKLLTSLKEVQSEVEDIQRCLKVVQPSFVSDVNAVQQQMEDREQQKRNELKRAEQKRAEKHKMHTSKALQHIKNSKSKDKASIKPAADNNHDDLIPEIDPTEKPTADQQQPDEQEPDTQLPQQKKKPIGATPKPAPRNLKEKDFEEQAVVNTSEWLPPSDKKQQNMENLKKRLGY